MDIDPSFSLVMSRLRAGDEDAAAEVFRRFARRLTALASHQFDARFRSKADPEDVVQSAYKSFFLRDGRSPFEVSDWEGLWALLALITLRKCTDRRVFWRAARRDVAREAAVPDLADAPCWDAVDRGPTPLQATVLAETLERLVGRFDARQRAVAELTLQGYTAAEVAERCDCSERTVARVVGRVRDRLREMEAAQDRT